LFGIIWVLNGLYAQKKTDTCFDYMWKTPFGITGREHLVPLTTYEATTDMSLAHAEMFPRKKRN
jgi:hypothetical protein